MNNLKFDNAGKKIKEIAEIVFIVVSVLLTILEVFNVASLLKFGNGSETILSIIVFLLEICALYFGLLVLCAFGELVHNSTLFVRYLNKNGELDPVDWLKNKP